MSCCRSSSAFSPKVLEELRKEMDAVNQIFPNTQHLSIITSDVRGACACGPGASCVLRVLACAHSRL
jgi:hypothetical protein